MTFTRQRTPLRPLSLGLIVLSLLVGCFAALGAWMYPTKWAALGCLLTALAVVFAVLAGAHTITSAKGRAFSAVALIILLPASVIVHDAVVLGCYAEGQCETSARPWVLEVFRHRPFEP